MIRTHTNLWITVLDRSQHLKTCGYWFLVTENHGPHTAFKTKAGLLVWMNERGLSLTQTLNDAGTWGNQKIMGEYREQSHYSEDEVKSFDDMKPFMESRVLSNGDYVEAKITLDADGIRTVHYLNTNIRTRHVFDYQESDKMIS